MIKNKKEFCVGEKLPVAKKSEIQTGRAYLRSSISGKSKEYSIEIEKIFLHEKDSLKTLKIKVTESGTDRTHRWNHTGTQWQSYFTKWKVSWSSDPCFD